MKTKIWKYFATVGIFSLFILFGCNSSTGNNSGDNQETTAAPKTDTVIINQMEFQPATLTIHPGDTVLWINKDIVAHNVTKDGEEQPLSKEIEAGGDSWSMVPKEGFSYFCSIHPTMKGSIQIAK